MRVIRRGSWLGVFLALIGLAGCGDSPSDVSQAVEYTVVKTEDVSFAGRTRVNRYVVAAHANTREQRAQTAIKAAMDLQHETLAQVSSVVVELSAWLAGHGHPVATADYAIDGRGMSGDQSWTWRVSASDEPVTPDRLRVAETYYQYRPRYRQPDGLTDEKGLEAKVRKVLGVDDMAITLGLHMGTLTAYPVE